MSNSSIWLTDNTLSDVTTPSENWTWNQWQWMRTPLSPKLQGRILGIICSFMSYPENSLVVSHSSAEMQCIYIYASSNVYTHTETHTYRCKQPHYHQGMPTSWIPLTFYRYQSLSAIALGKFSWQHLVSSLTEWM